MARFRGVTSDAGSARAGKMLKLDLAVREAKSGFGTIIEEGPKFETSPVSSARMAAGRVIGRR